VLQLTFAQGAPVIAMRAGGMSEAVEDGVTGFIVEPGGVAGLGHAIARRFREESADVFQIPIRRKRDLHGHRCAARPA
jgi:glycosyltransferase involved in cell wall biosynthesis